MNWIDLSIVGFCGSALLLSIFMGYTDLAGNIGMGLIGYLGGSVAGAVKQKKQQPSGEDEQAR